MHNTRRINPPAPLDLRRTLAAIQHGRDDPTLRLSPDGSALYATRTPAGPATVQLVPEGTSVLARAWGDGAAWLLEWAPALIGCLDDVSGFEDHHPAVARLRRQLHGLRLPRTGNVVEALIPAVLEQRVNAFEASRSFTQVIRAYGEPAPGPGDLTVPPHPEELAGVPYYDLHVLGVERQRADALRRVCAHAGRLQALVELPSAAFQERLQELPGIGQWTAAEVALRVLGDPDAVPLGDANLPGLVSWILRGEPDADDARMLALLEPWRGHRARVLRLFEASGQRPPRTAPRAALRDIAGT